MTVKGKRQGPGEEKGDIAALKRAAGKSLRCLSAKGHSISQKVTGAVQVAGSFVRIVIAFPPTASQAFRSI
jgi:hypothetical protein